MQAESLAEHMRDKLGDSVVDTRVSYGQLTLTVTPDALPLTARICKEDAKLAFDFFDFMSGVDEREEGLAVVTHLYSVRHQHHITIRAVAAGGREQPEMPSITDVYRGANWHEREAYDMYGIAFTGHPGLTPRILTVENFEGWPLRKEFLLTTREAKPWPGAKEPEETPKPDQAEEGGEQGAQKPAEPQDRAAAAKAKAERAKRKAAEMRAKKARERATAEQGGSEGGDQAAAAEPEEAAEATPEGAAEESGAAIAEDAAAGAVGGDVAAGATQDEPGAEKAVPDPEHEEQVGTGADPHPSGTPGPELEGRHADDEHVQPSKDAPVEPGHTPEADLDAARGQETDEAVDDDDEPEAHR